MIHGTMLVIFNGGGGDLYCRLLDDIASKHIESLAQQEWKSNWYYQNAVGEYLSEEGKGDGTGPGEGFKHILQSFNLQSPVIEELKAVMSCNKILYLHGL